MKMSSEQLDMTETKTQRCVCVRVCVCVGGGRGVNSVPVADLQRTKASGRRNKSLKLELVIEHSTLHHESP